MSAQSTVSQLDTSLHILHDRWNAAKTQWNDSVSAHFETHYLSPIEQQTKRTLAEMHELARILSEAQRKVR